MRCLLLLMALPLLAFGQDAGTGDATLIVAPRPVFEASMRIEKTYGQLVSYEDPVWQWRGDIETRGKEPEGPYGWWLIDQRFEVPDGAVGGRFGDLAALVKEWVGAAQLAGFGNAI